jgi:hypothetical protein
MTPYSTIASDNGAIVLFGLLAVKMVLEYRYVKNGLAVEVMRRPG